MIDHIIKAAETTKVAAVPLQCIDQKCRLVATSNRSFICHLANRFTQIPVVSCMFIVTVFIIIGYVVGACGLERSND